MEKDATMLEEYFGVGARFGEEDVYDDADWLESQYQREAKDDDEIDEDDEDFDEDEDLDADADEKW